VQQRLESDAGLYGELKYTKRMLTCRECGTRQTCYTLGPLLGVSYYNLTLIREDTIYVLSLAAIVAE
jgi:hypothetical protein